MMHRPIDRGRYLTGAELVRLFSALWRLEKKPPGPMAHQRTFFVRFAMGTGLRTQEIADLLLEDCSEEGVILVRHGKGSKQRQVRVTPECMPHYLHRLEMQRSGKLRWREFWPDQETHQWGWLFERWTHGTGWGPYRTRQFRRWWDWICAQAGIRTVHGPHGLRHTYATWEIACRRLRPHELQASLGHKRFEMTANIYNGGIVEHAYEWGAPDWYHVALTGEIPGKKPPRPMPGDPLDHLQNWLGQGKPNLENRGWLKNYVERKYANID